MQRLLFKKIQKGFKEQESVLASYKLRIQSLEVQLKKAKPRKQRKVKTSLNSKCADIKSIKKAQIEAKEAGIVDNNKEEANDSSSTLDCIEIE